MISSGVGCLGQLEFRRVGEGQNAPLDLDLCCARLRLVENAARRVPVDLAELVAIDGKGEAAVILEAP